MGLNQPVIYNDPNNNRLEFTCASFSIEELDLRDDCSTGGDPDFCCSYWTRSITPNVHSILGIPFISYDGSCTTGGENQCFLGDCHPTEVEESEA